MNAVLQYVLYVGILVAVSVPLGIYMSKVMDGETNIVTRILGPVERGIYKLLHIDPEENMGWKKYLDAYQIAALPQESQNLLYDTIESEQATPSLSQAQRIRKLSQSGKLNED